MTINLKIATDQDQEEWDRLIGKSPHGTIFHTWKWLKTMEKHTKSKLYPIIGLKGTTPVGAVPLFYQKKFLIKTVFSPPPHAAVPYLGPVLADYDKLKQSKKESVFIEFQRKLDEFVYSNIKANYVFIHLPPGLLDSRPFKWADYKIGTSYDYLFNLEDGIGTILKQTKRDLRRVINKTREVGVSVEQGSKKDLEFIYNSLVIRGREQGITLPISKKYLFDIYDLFHPQNMKIFIAKYQGEPVAGMIDLYYKNKVSSWLGNSKTTIKSSSPNDLIQWGGIKWAGEHNFKYYEIIGANIWRLCHYKSKFNPNISIHFSVKKYSSVFPKLAEMSYIRILKPINSKFKLKCST